MADRLSIPFQKVTTQGSSSIIRHCADSCHARWISGKKVGRLPRIKDDLAWALHHPFLPHCERGNHWQQIGVDGSARQLCVMTCCVEVEFHGVSLKAGCGGAKGSRKALPGLSRGLVEVAAEG